MTTPFALAQQAANTAYDMTMQQTGDEAQAADDYRAVMKAYDAAEVNPGWFVNPAADLDSAPVAARIGARYESWTQTPGGMRSIAHIGLTSGPAIEY